MKTLNKKLSSTLILMSLTMSTFNGAIANDEAYLNSDPIDINGYVKEVPVSDQELETVKNELRKQNNAIKVNKVKAKKYGELSRSTEKLADATEELIEERKESQVTIDKYNKKIECLMAEAPKKGCEKYQKNHISDEVSVSHAAPKVEAKLTPSTSNDKFGETIKILPYSGLTTFFTDENTLEAGLTAGIRAETNVSSRFSVGMGFKYTSFSTLDRNTNGMNNGLNIAYNSFYGTREIEYSNMKFDVYSKFFLINSDRFRPYIGAGLGYNRSTMNYLNNSVNNFASYNFGNEEVNTSHIDAQMLVGSEVIFTKSIGMNLELAYNRGIGGNLSSENGINPFFAPDQQRLQDLSEEVNDANIISLNASLLIQF